MKMIFFENNWRLMVDDFIYQLQHTFHPVQYSINDSELRDMLLTDLEYILSRNGAHINMFNLPRKTHSNTYYYGNRLIEEEMSYDIDKLEEEANKLYLFLNTDQKHAFHTIAQNVLDNKPGLYFVHGYGGTGKTYLWNTIVYYLRAHKKIVLTVASSEVASLLLPNGRTAHSRFKIPIDIDDTTTCEIKRDTILAELLRTSLIIWDETIMTNKQCFEALDRSLRDIHVQINPDAQDLPFGGKVIVLGGDLQQILPIIENGSRSQIIDATIVKSYL
uniref:ATP-dependent DNA helicase n=1 Tax=Arundo donax TaxID=35708 RepID=A0A0A9FAH8_ARUDO